MFSLLNMYMHVVGYQSVWCYPCYLRITEKFTLFVSLSIPKWNPIFQSSSFLLFSYILTNITRYISRYPSTYLCTSESSFYFTSISMLPSVFMYLYLCVCMITMMMVSVIIKAIIIISKSCIPSLLLCSPTLFPSTRT